MDDPTAELFRNMPRETVKFLRVVLGVGTITSVGMLFYAVPALVSQFSVPTPLMASPLLSSPLLTSPLHAAPYPYASTEDSVDMALVSMSDEPTPTLSPLVPPQYIHYSSWSSATPWSHRLLLVWLIAVTLFQVIMLPLRFRLANRLAVDVARLPRDRLIATMLELLQSFEWRINKYAGSLAYWFLIIGSCLTSFARTWANEVDALVDAGVPGTAAHNDDFVAALRNNEIVSAAMVTLAAFAARMAFSFCWFFYNFVYGNNMPNALGRNGRAADDDMLKLYLQFQTFDNCAEAKEGVVEPTPVPSTPVADPTPLVPSCCSEHHLEHEPCGRVGEVQLLSPVSSSPLPSPLPAPTPSPASTAGSTTDSTHNVPGCSICLMDFEAGDRTAALPCSPMHVFHANCVVPWLRIQKRCPLCTLDIDEPRGTQVAEVEAQ